MVSNSSDANLVNYLNLLSSDLNRYLSILILLFGTIGNLLNCLALSQRTLRSNSCASLFLASSVASIITLISGVAVRLLAGWSFDLTDTVNTLCKLRIFVLFASRTSASWFITLATCDRWLSSSLDANRRQFATLRNAQRGVIIVVFLSCLAYAQVFYCYEANLTNAPLKCYGRTSFCRLLIDSEFASISVICPSLFMFTFGFLTILNIRYMSQRRVRPTLLTVDTQIVTTRVKKPDQYFLSMLWIQVMLLTLFSLPQVIQNLYGNITQSEVKSALQKAINNFVFNMFILLTYVTNGMPFYIYTLTGGRTFRGALQNSIRDFMHIFSRCHQK